MDFRFSKIMLLLCAVIGVGIFSAPAQPAGQSIIFSTPQDSDASASAPPSTPQTPDQSDLTEQSAPASLFRPAVPAQQLPATQPQIISPAGRERMKQLQEDQKNWALMSPEEIFGMATQDQDADGNEKDENQVARYLDRQNRLQTGPTNGAPDASKSPWNFSRNNDRSDANWFNPEQNKAENAMQSLSQLLSSKPKDNVAANPNNKSGWNIFGASQSQPSQQSSKLDLAQKEAMDRFRELLEPKLPSVSAVSASANSPYFPAPKLDPNITQPDFTPNPSGASFTPLTAGINRPTGLTPLPGIVTPAPQVATTPAWAPQLPPWLSQGPQPFPQRKF